MTVLLFAGIAQAQTFKEHSKMDAETQNNIIKEVHKHCPTIIMDTFSEILTLTHVEHIDENFADLYFSSRFSFMYGTNEQNTKSGEIVVTSAQLSGHTLWGKSHYVEKINDVGLGICR